MAMVFAMSVDTAYKASNIVKLDIFSQIHCSNNINSTNR